MTRGLAVCTCRKYNKKFEKMRYNFSKRADAESWEKWVVDNCIICPECEKSERLSDIFNLADEIRAIKYEEAQKFIKEIQDISDNERNVKKAQMCADYLFKNKRTATYWIDKRDSDIGFMLVSVLDKIKVN